MNSYFASAEQQLRPELRGRPTAVAALDVDSTCCIAVSQEAKDLGVVRGTPVGLARKCNVKIVEARPALYVEMHHAIIAAVDTCLPVQTIHSIDELSCRLEANAMSPSAAIEMARRVKRAIYTRVGSCLRCSIGLAPNRFLAKVAAGMQKPDGLTVINDCDLPQVLFPLSLDDFPGIGPRMLSRLHKMGITTVQQLCQLSEQDMKTLWTGIVGQRWWYWLRGHDLFEAPSKRSTVGHSHVLPPELRTEQGAQAVLIRLIHKAAARLRRLNFWARRLEVYISFTFREEGWFGSVNLGLCQDTLTMIEAFHALWRTRHMGRHRPTQVGITLYDLVPTASATLPLFPFEQRRVELARVIDNLNDRFGVNTVYFGGMQDVQKSAPTRIAFTQIPDRIDD